jgi:hypothetical protein
MSFLKNIFGSSRRITASAPMTIESPRIGFFNLMGASAESILIQDKVAIAPLFSAMQVTETGPPVCDVLMIYANIGSDGRIPGTANGLREIIRNASAPIVVVASENEPNRLIAAARPAGYGQANLVLTLKRNGPAFPTFFSALFSEMYRGVTMPNAWVKLAPQIPRAKHDNCPETIFSAEISHIVFKG